MALLRDMQDGTNDQPHRTTQRRTLQGRDEHRLYEILQVFKTTIPRTWACFLNDFRARYPQYDMDLYSTTDERGPTFSSRSPIRRW
jgi:hypothetical protein